MPKHLATIAYVLLIITGAIGIIIPGGIHICLACGSILDTIREIVAIVVGIAGLAAGRQAVAI